MANYAWTIAYPCYVHRRGNRDGAKGACLYGVTVRVGRYRPWCDEDMAEFWKLSLPLFLMCRRAYTTESRHNGSSWVEARHTRRRTALFDKIIKLAEDEGADLAARHVQEIGDRYV